MNEPLPLDLARLERALPALAGAYRAMREAPHGVLDGFLDESWLARHDVAATLRRLGHSGAVEEYRYYTTRSAATKGYDALPPALRSLVDVLHSPAFVSWLERLTGIDGLLPDVELANGGVHYMRPGGYIELHRDELIHPFEPDLRRRLNLLVYLGAGWQESYGGHLELWTNDARRRVARIAPAFNRLVVTTIDANVHGVPERVRCPVGEFRQTLILWYYTREAGRVPFESVRFYAPPGAGPAQRALVGAESALYRLFHRVKRHVRLDNAPALWLMRRLGYDDLTRRRS